MSIGFVKLHRKLLEWEWYSDINVSRLFIHLLLKANFEDKKWQGKIIKRGELITSRDTLSREINLSETQIRGALNKLKSTNEITIETTNKNTKITLCNYSVYQDKSEMNNQQNNQQNSQRITNKQPTDNQQITTTKEDKKLRSKETYIPPTPFSGDSGGVCLADFFKGGSRDNFKEDCLAIARGKKFTDTEAEKHFIDFVNYWLSPALPATKAKKKNWQRAFLNWIAKNKPIKANNFDIANDILISAKNRLSDLLDNDSDKLDSNLIFLKALKNGYSKQQIFNILADILNNPPKEKIYSWAIINQYIGNT